MNEVLPGRAGRLVKENEDIWKAYQNLGQACYEAGPLEASTLRLVKLALRAAAMTLSPKISPHSLKARFEVRIMAPLS